MTILATLVSSGRIRLAAVVAMAAACAIGSGPAAFAQGAADARITNGLFAGGNKGSSSFQHLDFQFDASETFDTKVPARFAPALTPDALTSGGYSTLVKGSANYSRKLSRIAFQADASGAARYYAALDETRIVTGTAGLGLTSELTRHTDLLLNQTLAYSPSYLYQLLPTADSQTGNALPIAAPDYDIGEFRSSTYGTSLTFADHQLAGGRLDATGAYSKSSYGRSDLPHPDSTAYSAEARYFRKVSRSTELSAGYRYRTGNFGSGGRTTERGIPVGVNYVRALSRTRQAALSLTVTPESVEAPETASAGSPSGRSFRLSADGSFSYPVYRSWFSSVNASRRVEYLAAVPQPVFSTRAQAAVEGFVTTRTHVSVSISYSNDKSILNEGSFNLEMYAGDALVRYALARKLAVYGGYVFYTYDPRGGREALLDIPSRLAHTGARVGLMLFVPVLGR